MKRLIALLTVLLISPAAAACAQRAASADPPPPPRHIPAHIPVWAKDLKFSEGETATSDQVRKYVTYAMGGLGNDKAVRDCAGSGRCFSLFYFDPALVYDSSACPFSADKDVIAAASEDWFVHLPGYSDAAHRVRGSYTQTCKGSRIAVPVYALNQNNPAVARYFARYLQRNADSWDFYEMDDTSTTIVDQFYGPGGGFCKDAGAINGYCTETSETKGDDELRAAHESFISNLKHLDGSPMQLFYNGIGFGPEGPRVSLLRNPQFRGAICEGCVVSGSLRPSMYAKTLDAMARVNAIPNAQFVELGVGAAPSGSDEQIAQRLVTTAIAWLGFSDGHTVVWPELASNTRELNVWPEDELYPASAYQSMRESARDLEVGPSIWRREFAHCYRSGAAVGPCAVVLNGTAFPVTLSPSWFHARFSHALTLRGGVMLDGGSLDFTGATVPSSIAAGHAVLLVR